MSNFNFAIIGKPNTGKSSIFNILCGYKKALVYPVPGVTRDLNGCEIDLGSDAKVSIWDTAGISDNNEMEAKISQVTKDFISEAHGLVIVVDGSLEPDYIDKTYASWLFTQGKPKILVINKCDKKEIENWAWEYESIYGTKGIIVSAAHRIGMDDLINSLKELSLKLLDELGNIEEEADSTEDIANEDNPDIPKFAIVGRTNVGKSTLFNLLLGKEHMIAYDQPGVTRDVVEMPCVYGERDYIILDTPGIRRKAKIHTQLESLMVKQMQYIIKGASIVVVLVDAQEGICTQDSFLIHSYLERGFGVIIACNKLDIADLNLLNRDLETKLPSSTVSSLPVINISAQTGEGVDALLEQVDTLHLGMKNRIGTGVLNRWLHRVMDELPPPFFKGKQVKLRYTAQVSSNPPIFHIFTNFPMGITESYKRYLVNKLRDEFGFKGSPVKIKFKGNENPYVK